MDSYTVGTRFLRDPKGRPHVPIGPHFVPKSGPDWPWRTDSNDFADAFASIAAAGLNTVRIDLIWAAVEPEPGRYNEKHLQEIDRIFDAAEHFGISLHPTLFVGGEVGDAYWDLPWAKGRNPHSDPELLRLQAAHAAMLARRWRDREALIAWDLTDEPPFWLYSDSTSDDDARKWTRTLIDAIRSEDSEHLITVGTASQEIDHGPFRADVVAPMLDFACVHPYPIYSPEYYPDRLLSRRMTQSAAFEVALARGAGREVMLHEFGASSTQYSPEAIALYDRLLTATAFGAGAIGFYSWCWIDAEPAAYERAPYVRMPHETQFGMVEHDGSPRPRLGVLTALAKDIAALDLDGFASGSPLVSASIPLPAEYSSPYDPENYNLGVNSPYSPAEAAWTPDRPVQPLVRGLLNSYVLAARAGLSVQFPRENTPAQTDTTLSFIPAPLTSTTNSLLHLQTSYWKSALARVELGETVYLSCSAETAIPELADLAGVSIVERARIRKEHRVRFVRSVGDVESGTEFRIAGAGSDLHLRGVELGITDAEVLAVDQDNIPVLTLARRGKGSVVVCALPVELLLAETPDAHDGDEPTWSIYRAVAAIAGMQPMHHPDLTVQNLQGPLGGLTVIANHSASAVDVELTPPEPAASYATTTKNITIDAHDTAMLPWHSAR